MHDVLLQAFALLCSLCGMAWLALAMDVHWQQASGRAGPGRRAALRLRAFAVAAIAASLGLFLVANHPSIAVLAWVMALVTAALLVAFALSYRPRWLAWLAAAAK